MKTVLLIMLFCFGMLAGYGQGENNIWTLDAMNTRLAVLDFNASPAPQVNALPQGSIGGTAWSSAVCFPNGQLRFYVRLSDNMSWSSLPNVYLPNGDAVVGSNLSTGALVDNCMPVVVPHPGNHDQYYIFYTKNSGLLYALLDMSMNSGHGGMVQKDVLISGYGTIVTPKITAIQGCDGVWLVARSRIYNQFLSFHVGHTGIDVTAVRSNCGNLGSLSNYNAVGYLKASTDGRRLVLTCWKGIEVYDFEKCSGKVQNPIVVDTNANAEFVNGAINDPAATYYYGAAFSPNASKIYVTSNTRQPSGAFHGQLFQFDVSLGSPATIAASKVLIINNPDSKIDDLGHPCILDLVNPMHSVKLGPDGKIYADNGSYTCLPPALVPPGYNPGPGFHVIHNPDASGLACNPELNKILLYPFTHNLGNSFTTLGANTQQDIVIAPPPPDTLSTRTFFRAVCFRDSVLLHADEGSCYLWDEGTTDAKRFVDRQGTYYVRYYKSCNIQVDTYKVSFVKMPFLSSNGHSCPGKKDGILSIYNAPNDTTTFKFIWKDESGTILQESESSCGDTLSDLQAGKYSVRVITASGCDTTLNAITDLLPAPFVQVWPSDTAIKYGDAITLWANGAARYEWLPDVSLNNTSGPSPTAAPLIATTYTVMGWNEWGCASRASANVAVDYNMPDFVPSAFTPNGDGINDIFRIVGLTYQKLLAFDVFNRFGERVFSTTDPRMGWDGTHKGKPCELGTYYYLIQLSYPDGKIKSLKGDVTLIR